MGRSDDFNPGFWGPPTWKVLLIFTLSYPWSEPGKIKISHFEAFFNSLQETLPCEMCRQSLRVFIRDHPIRDHLTGKIKLLRWVVKLYNDKRPEKSQLKTLKDLRQVLDPDPTVSAIITEIRRKYPDFHF